MGVLTMARLRPEVLKALTREAELKAMSARMEHWRHWLTTGGPGAGNHYWGPGAGITSLLLLHHVVLVPDVLPQLPLVVLLPEVVSEAAPESQSSEN